MGSSESHDENHSSEAELSSGTTSDSSQRGNCGITANTSNKDDLTTGDIRSKIMHWALRHIHILTQLCIDDLLVVLKSEGHVSLPMSSKTLLGTSRIKTNAQLMLSNDDTYGEFKYFGIRKNLIIVIDPEVFTATIISLLINIDGVEVHNKSKKCFWTISGKIYSESYFAKPFLIAIFYGNSKPRSARDFLEKLNDEVNDFIVNGVDIRGVSYEFKIAGFTCDTPARAFIKCCKGHTGFYSCERCIVRGVTVNKKRIFPDENCEERTSESFRNKSQIEHHLVGKISPVLDIIGFDPVVLFFLDSMHLLFLGVGKRYLELQITGARTNIGTKNITHLQELFDTISKDISDEFQRKVFDVRDSCNWKATQFRFFVLYAGGIFLRYVLPEEKYKHFMLFFVACRILCSKKLAVEHCKYAKALLKKFFKLMPTFYGSDSQIMNFHNLIHVADDVEYMRAPLTAFSAFDFENSLGFLKKLVNSSTHPIAQVDRKICALQSTTAKSISSRFPYTFSVEKRGEEMLRDCKFEIIDNETVFQSITLPNFVLTTTHPDNVIETKCGKVIRICKISSKKTRNLSELDVQLDGYSFDVAGSAFEYPVPSTCIGIFQIRNSKNAKRKIQRINISDIYTKCIYTEIQKKKFAITLLH